MNESESQTSDPEVARAREVARRLHSEIQGLLSGLPEGARKAGGLVRLLGVDRSTCQRVVSAATLRGDPLTVFVRLPGVEGLRRVIAAARERGLSKERADAAAAAADLYAELVDEHGGSQAQLTRWLEQAVRGGAPGCRRTDAEYAQIRRRIFEGAALLTGRATDVHVTIGAIRPMPDDPGMVESANVKGYIGLEYQSGAMPLVRIFYSDERVESGEGPRGGYTSLNSDEPADGFSPGALLKDFSTTPLPVVTGRCDQGVTVQVIDPKGAGGGGKLDAVLGARKSPAATHPAGHEVPEIEISYDALIPTRKLVFDVYLHRSMASACVPTVFVLQPNKIATAVLDRWFDEFEDQPRLELLGAGLRRAHTDSYERHEELSYHLFDTLGWDADEFVGFRMSVDHPIWCADYIVKFDFAEHSESGSEDLPEASS